jgi:hypothetical protein
VQYAIYRRVLATDLHSPDPVIRQAALRRWMKVVLIWQGVELIPVFAWVIPNAVSHTRQGLWILPPAGLLVGSAVSLQPTLSRIARALRP